ncbi:MULTISPECIES: hypothetical protein [unclassified Rhodococcus (in: high G+C Gram-positive bacteria)]|uniref:hypothetical protein n=1 Tax=unclassified Rhodococcus (in: high G+C Gram-positive bacteria) TaxID=192944 RepID=UPI000304B095|nr:MULTISPECIES: hypothetical protein [unclassified Rhodococcus (in: high G+C Gram-positive bacteria)]MBC2637427.1 hypothetical protein [Rhodococcus sp. 3A]MBC2898157.1 hypothetical protein [Rhodococcus sp. 4CII]
MDNPLHTVPEADRLEQDLPADPGLLLTASPTDDWDPAWDVPEADRFEQIQPVAPVDDPLHAGGLEAGWDAPEGDRLEQAVSVAFDAEWDQTGDEAFEEDRQ